ncbi:MAG TPA: cytochrome c-type biogenesis protein CcmH [Terriglobia bacterium]|jgi:cytochrome c-type biogenesis protein CcmH|nr:cytochrome c-type biogenesis protein CcmH [Terriglobia bacterium]
MTKRRCVWFAAPISASSPGPGGTSSHRQRPAARGARIAVLAAFVLSLGSGRAAAKPTQQSIEGALTCQCGCNQTVAGCDHYGCGSREEMRAFIQKEIAAGKDETAIFQDMTLRYGVKVLAVPPAQGFNLTVWILPILGLMVGLAAVVLFVRHWRKTPGEPPYAPPSTMDPKVMAAVEAEMKKVGSLSN